MKKLFFFVWMALLLPCLNTFAQKNYSEPHRPQIHFSPAAHWMNDPNGMVYYKGTYHLFYQYYPEATVWGPMHWGHATSKDLMHWQHQPIALYPDELGYIFSGSAVADVNNTSGLGTKAQPPLVAIFTSHDPKGEKSGKNDYENQSIAYSVDDGKTWKKYGHNPVVKNPGIKDFRDPKVSWNEAAKKWIMTLAVTDHIEFYSSPNLKDWKKESEFGKQSGAHGGVWECPDLFPLDYKGKKIWVLIVNINPGGPNGGSATQYFTGTFDGYKFTADHTDTKWIDYGPDEYAGITWGNTGARKIFLGWMSNWLYADKVPTEKWRSAMTIPRELKMSQVGDKYLVSSIPVKELSVIEEKAVSHTNVDVHNFDLGKMSGPAKLEMTSDKIESFAITFSNDAGEQVVVGYDKGSSSYFIDRTKSGKVDFKNGFAAKHVAPRMAGGQAFNMILVIDNASIELFADDGLTVMTEIFFPSANYSKVALSSGGSFKVAKLKWSALKGVW